MTEQLLLAAESLAAKNSGIGRVARLMAMILAERRAGSDVRLRGVGLSDRVDHPLEWPWVTPCSGGRLEYVLRVQTDGRRAQSVLYDSLSMARAHFMGPARWTRALTWMHGVEVWEDARPEHLAVAHRIPVLVTNSEYTRRRASSLHPHLERARVCWLGTETDEPPSVEPNRDSPATALLLSRIDSDSYKGHRQLIDAWPRVQRDVPGARLIIAGDGPGVDEVRALAQASAAADRIELIGYVPEPELPALWARTNVLAMPSRGEGFGLTYIEAMRYGVPVIASKQDAGQEVNVDGGTGFNVDLDRPAELAESLVALLGDGQRARAFGLAGHRRWERHFTYSAFKRRFLAILDAGWAAGGRAPR